MTICEFREAQWFCHSLVDCALIIVSFDDRWSGIGITNAPYIYICLPLASVTVCVHCLFSWRDLIGQKHVVVCVGKYIHIPIDSGMSTERHKPQTGV